MKESVSVTVIFQIFILFVLLFTAIMCLTINNSNAFAVKDEIVNIIESNNGKYLDDDNRNLSEEIVELLANTSYRTTGVCDDEYTGYQRNGQPVGENERAAVCIKKISVTDYMDDYLVGELGDGMVATEDFKSGSYYQVAVFYQLDLPIIEQFYNFQTVGETKIIYTD